MAKLPVTREDLLAHNVFRYFSQNQRAWDIVCGYVESTTLPDGRVPMSLRSVDHLVRKYAQERTCEAVDDKGKKHNVAREYDLLKRDRHKQSFDAFRRYNRTVITFHGKPLMTTVGQLAFFSWALQNGVLDFAERHRDDIEASKSRELMEQRQARTTAADSEEDAAASTAGRKRKRPVVSAVATAGAAVTFH